MAAAFSWHIMMASVIDVRASSSALLPFAEEGDDDDDESEVDDDAAPPPPGDSGEEAVRKEGPELPPLPLLLPLTEDAAAATVRAHFTSRARVLAR